MPKDERPEELPPGAEVERRECAVGAREVDVSARESHVSLREAVASSSEAAVRAMHDRQAAIEQMRAANEQLVLATLRAEDATTAAERMRVTADEATVRAEEDRNALELEAQLREQLMGIVGHDLRNPLAAILMAAQMLMRTAELTRENRAALAGIHHSALRMRHLIEQLLDFTRVHQGSGLSVEPRPADLRQICETVVRELEVGLRMPGRFECDYSGELTGVWDSERLTQVVSNIAGNAVEHGAPGAPILLTVRGSADEVVIEVCNSGAPIPAEILPVIFQPFQRGQEGAQANGGLGLGLYIAHELVLAHRGEIRVRSTMEGVTTFTIELPRVAR